MAHKEQIQFCQEVKKCFPEYFKGTKVLDVGSLDINGTNRYLFEDCEYIGIDVLKGKNVDIVIPVHEYIPIRQVDVVVSTEMLEHDKYWKASLKAMYDLLREGGLMLITCATKGRKEHGTHEKEPESSPGTLGYYKNIYLKEFNRQLPGHLFKDYRLQVVGTDLQFYGIKK
ncbi:MAG: class I SAM-dependent methyltransferase [Proteobacteria bacterium]|nr:class I SAM-dependent methyltransferase [Pseudomonadota bacterium]